MTIAISVKVNDGLVLASDSASTVLGLTPGGELQVVNIYYNAIKVFNLRKGLPVGAITWGAGSIGQASISAIIKDLRERFTSETGKKGLKIDPENYSVEAVAQRLREFVYEGLYVPEFKSYPSQQKPALGFIVAGYSARAPMADEFQIDIQNGACSGPRKLREQAESGLTWAGEPDALNRVIMGVGSGIAEILRRDFKIPEDQLVSAEQTIQKGLQIPVVFPAMPLQDAIDLAEFMVDMTIKFSRFRPGAPTVGGPIEIAAISKHEGFRWIKRKYYFNRDLNPEELFPRVFEPSNKQP